MTVRSAPDVEPAYIQEHRKIRIRREDHSREIRRGRHTATEIHRETTERIMAIHGQPYVDPKDHSAEFDGKDIADHKLFAMLPYLLGILGTIVALLVAKDSPYVGFHVREGIRILVSEVLLGLITVVFCWTVVVPIAAAICFIILLVVRIISFVNVCNGKAKEAAIVSNFGFLK